MNNSLPVAKVAIPLPIDKLFDYHIPKRLLGRVQIGSRVYFRFCNRRIIGYVIDCLSTSKISKLNPILDILDKGPIISCSALQLAKKIKDYYICSLGIAIEAMLPNVLRQSNDIASIITPTLTFKSKDKRANTSFVQDLNINTSYNYFIDEIIKRVKEGGKIIFVVPEIKIIDSVKMHISKICNIRFGIWYGGVSKKHILNLWNDLACDAIDLVIGTRSCIFAPLKNLSLIIIQDEGNYAYKDDQVPYYHAVKVAQMRSEIDGCDIILSSAVPSASTYQQMSNKKITFKEIKKPAQLAEIQNIGINYKDKINLILENEIGKALENNEKTLIFLNRKGFATFIYCKKCKKSLQCNRCSSNLRFDYSVNKLICPHCNYKIEVTEICPICNSSYVKFGGLGLEKLESTLKRSFPSARVNKIEDLIKNGQMCHNYDIIVATKSIGDFQGLNFDITIIWSLDSLINIGNFRSGEETFQLLAKLLLKTKKKMIICSGLNQEFYLLNYLKNIDFKQFYKVELKTRKDLHLPPYYYTGLISIRGHRYESVDNTASSIYSSLNKSKSGDLEISNFSYSLPKRLRGKYYRYLLVKSKKESLLNMALKKSMKCINTGNVIVTVNIDPL